MCAVHLGGKVLGFVFNTIDVGHLHFIYMFFFLPFENVLGAKTNDGVQTGEPRELIVIAVLLLIVMRMTAPPVLDCDRGAGAVKVEPESAAREWSILMLIVCC